MSRPAESPVGLLLLETTYMDRPGAMGHSATFDFPVIRRHVPGAVTSVIVSDQFAALTADYVASARDLAGEGVQAIVSNCGFSVAFQEVISADTGLPTFTSALLLAPLLDIVFGGRLAVLTYDAQQIDAARRRAARWPEGFDPPMADVASSREWRKLSAPAKPELDYDEMERDLIEVAQQLVAEHDVRALLIECTAMLPFESSLFRATGLPVFGAPGFIHYLVERINGHGLADQVASHRTG